MKGRRGEYEVRNEEYAVRMVQVVSCRKNLWKN